MILSTDDGRFPQDVLHASEPTVVEFWAPWCGHCRRLEPALEQLAEKGRRVMKVNVDQAPQTARRYGIGSIPALLCFRGGQPGPALVGPGSAAEIEGWLASQLG